MKTFTFLIMLLAISACSSTNILTKDEKNTAYQAYITKQQLISVNKVTAFKFDSWRSLTDNYLIISSSINKNYLIELNSSCSDLSFAHGIVVNQSSSASLSRRFDSISHNEMPGFNCYIKSIYKLTRPQVKEVTAIGKKAA